MKTLLNGPWLGVGILIVAAAVAGVSQWRLGAAREDARESSRLLEESRRYANQIVEHQDLPTLVSDHEMELTLLANLIEQAADEAKINRQALDRIWPQPARRIGESPYQRKPTQLVLRDVTLAQGIEFLQRLTASPHTQLNVDSLRLSAPRSTLPESPTMGSKTTAPETWTLEATISHLLYQPLQPESSDSSLTQRN